MCTRAIKLDVVVWTQLNKGIWPIELEHIKPEKWESCDAYGKGRLMIDNFDQFIFHLKLLKSEIA